ncbi:hypothetical protein [Jatrophihabitans sp.]|uniref:hypothetical protein n=1 Tax=Jatrophihabitans sp. TaxID=1932789 RepID=UPI002C36F6BA|nr:hypothetical protein [Jatrophihabitans sp.]
MYLPPGYPYNPEREAREREAMRSDPFILIDYSSLFGVWRAAWTDKISLLGSCEGTREQCIAWARERSDNIRICSNPHDPAAIMVQLGPDDE